MQVLDYFLILAEGQRVLVSGPAIRNGYQTNTNIMSGAHSASRNSQT